MQGAVSVKLLWLMHHACVSLLSGVPLTGTGFVHVTNWLIKRPGYLSALQQVIGRFFPSEGLKRGERRVSSLQHWWET